MPESVLEANGKVQPLHASKSEFQGESQRIAVSTWPQYCLLWMICARGDGWWATRQEERERERERSRDREGRRREHARVCCVCGMRDVCEFAGALPLPVPSTISP